MRNHLLNKPREEGKYYTYGMPDMENFLKMRGGYDLGKGFESEENSATVVFFKVFMPCCGSYTNYSEKYHEELITDIYSPSQEGFVLIELMNNYGKWTEKSKELYGNTNAEDSEEEVQKNQQETSEKIDDSTDSNVKYTSRGTLYTNSRFCVSMDGWSEDGMMKYNKLCHLAEKDRANDHGKEFETLFRNEEKKKRNVKSDQRVINEEDYIRPYNNLEDELDDDSSDDDDNDDDEDDEDDEHIATSFESNNKRINLLNGASERRQHWNEDVMNKQYQDVHQTEV